MADERAGEVEFVGEIRSGAAKAETHIAPAQSGDVDFGLANGREYVTGRLRQVLRDGLLVRQIRAQLHLQVGAQCRFGVEPALADEAEAGGRDDVVDIANGVALAIVTVEQGPVDLTREADLDLVGRRGDRRRGHRLRPAGRSHTGRRIGWPDRAARKIARLLRDQKAGSIDWRHAWRRQNRRLLDPLLQSIDLALQRFDLLLILVELRTHLLQHSADAVIGLSRESPQQGRRDAASCDSTKRGSTVPRQYSRRRTAHVHAPSPFLCCCHPAPPKNA